MVQDEALKQQYLAQAKAKLKKEAKIMKIVKIVFSALLICIGYVCFIFSRHLNCHWHYGTEGYSYYGDDAYLKFCENIADNVYSLCIFLYNSSCELITALQSLLLTISFVLAVVGIYLVIKNVLTRTKIDCELAQEMADEMYEKHLAKPAPQPVYNQYAPMQQMPYGQPPMAPMNQPPVNPDQNNENN